MGKYDDLWENSTYLTTKLIETGRPRDPVDATGRQKRTPVGVQGWGAGSVPRGRPEEAPGLGGPRSDLKENMII